MNAQRNAIYGMRRKVLEGQEIERTTLDWLGDVVSNFLDTYVPENGKKEEWNIEGLNNSLSQTFGFKIDTNMPINSETVTEAVKKGVKEIFEKQKIFDGPILRTSSEDDSFAKYRSALEKSPVRD